MPLQDLVSPPGSSAGPNALVRHFRCPEPMARLAVTGDLSEEAGFFTFEGATCYARRAGHRPARYSTGRLLDAAPAVALHGGRVGLPFEVCEVVENLQQERYLHRARRRLPARRTAVAAARHIYYFLRPGLSVPVRKHLQRLRLRGWEAIRFPRWPVDDSIEALMASVLRLLLKHGEASAIPFIWFWPDGAQSALIMTHDVEGPAGRDFCNHLMDLDDRAGVKSAFQIVPEFEHDTLPALARHFRSRGFEVNLHDLNHDGYLFQNRDEFLRRVVSINAYARDLGCRGFRSGAMYRKQHWFGALDFDYDMSVPNAAHLEPQRGGCCTVMPFFIGRLVELPLTTVQDYSLFHILNDYSIALWKQQIATIAARNGLVSFITHPDYLIEPRARQVYVELLEYIREVRSRMGLWVTLPGEVERWWRLRSEMHLVPDGRGWRIAGAGSERARLAYATLEGDEVVFRLEDPVPVPASSPRPLS